MLFNHITTINDVNEELSSGIEFITNFTQNYPALVFLAVVIIGSGAMLYKAFK